MVYIKTWRLLFLVSAMSFIEHILFVSVPLMAPGLLCRPHKKCLRAVRRGPHFVLKHETTFFTPGSALRIRQVSLGWTRDSVSGLCQEPQAPGPIFAERRPRETELSSWGASTPRLGFIPSSPAAPSPRPVPGAGKARGLTPRASASRRYTPSRFRYPGSRPILPALAAGQSGHR